MMKRIIFSGLVIGLAVWQAGAQPVMPQGITLYAGGSLTFDGQSSVLGGDTVAGGDVLHDGGGLYVESIFGGGGFSLLGATTQASSGEWYFNGDIVGLGGPGKVIGGPVRSTAGNIDFRDGSQEVFGDVVAAGNIEWDFSFGEVYGNVVAGGIADVTANVTGTISSGAVVNLPAFVPPALPAGRNLTPSSNHITLSSFEDLVLPPGVYGDLTLASSNTVSLRSGSYVFNNLVNSFTLNKFDFDLSDGPIDLFFAQGVNLNVKQLINGVELSSLQESDGVYASQLFVETGGNLERSGDFYGTLFAPNGDVSLSYATDVTGRIFAGGDVLVHGGDVIDPGLHMLGDVNGDGALTNGDISAFVLALTDPPAYAASYPALNPDVVGDFSGDGQLTNGDIAGFVAALTGAGTSAVPEPAGLALLAIGGLLVGRRRSR